MVPLSDGPQKMYRFAEPLKEGTVVSRPSRFLMTVRVGRKTLNFHCPTTGRLGEVNVSGLPCLYSLTSGPERQTAGTVEAISFDQSEKVIRSWIGINQTAVNRYVEHFLENGLLSRMVTGKVEREVKLGNSRIDFLVGNTFFEVKTPLTALPSPSDLLRVRHARFDSFDRLIRHMTELRKSLEGGRRAIIALCYLYDAQPFKPPMEDGHNSRILAAARAAENGGVENWQINMSIKKEGVTLLRYFKSVHFS
jgi:sugar fermentation stimulation protein A